eukprot:3852381-Rhodomonas_salina.3
MQLGPGMSKRSKLQTLTNLPQRLAGVRVGRSNCRHWQRRIPENSSEFPHAREDFRELDRVGLVESADDLRRQNSRETPTDLGTHTHARRQLPSSKQDVWLRAYLPERNENLHKIREVGVCGLHDGEFGVVAHVRLEACVPAYATPLLGIIRTANLGEEGAPRQEVPDDDEQRQHHAEKNALIPPWFGLPTQLAYVSCTPSSAHRMHGSHAADGERLTRQRISRLAQPTHWVHMALSTLAPLQTGIHGATIHGHRCRVDEVIVAPCHSIACHSPAIPLPVPNIRHNLVSSTALRDRWAKLTSVPDLCLRGDCQEIARIASWSDRVRVGRAGHASVLLDFVLVAHQDVSLWTGFEPINHRTTKGR